MAQNNLKLPEANTQILPDANASVGLQVVRPASLPVVNHGAQASPTQQQLGQGITSVNGASVHHAHGQQSKPQQNQFDDEISTFFKNRQLVMQGSTDLHPLVKILLAMALVIGGYLVAWNHLHKVRVKSDELAQQYLQMPIAEFMPAWSVKAKSYVKRNQLAAQNGSIVNQNTKILNGPNDAMYLATVTGAWGHVDAFTSMKCMKWAMSYPCSVRAWYLAYRGMKSSLKPLLAMDLAQAKNLTKREMAVFLYAKSILLDGAASDQLFQEALSMAKDDKEIRRMIFDARFKSILKENRLGDIGAMIKMVPKIGASAQDIGKWKALEMASRFAKDPASAKSPAQATAIIQLTDLMKKHAGSFTGDPVGFLFLANASLKLGLAKQISPMTHSFASTANGLKLDSSLKRDILIVNARISMVLGQLSHAAQLLTTLQKNEGLDSISSHMLGSLIIEMRNANRMADAVLLFASADRSGANWQSQYGLLISLIKLDRLKEANKIAGELFRAKNALNETWVKLGICEYKFALAGKSGDLALARYQEVAKELEAIHIKHPKWQGVAKLYADALAKSNQMERSQEIRVKVDELAAKTSYLSSSEYMESPIGPFALMR